LAFGFVVRNARPTLATSFSWVNPIVALLLGVGIAGERLAPTAVLGMLTILGAVALVAAARPPRGVPDGG
jgi:drug/metabolite transporter (DMT)-like permease